MSTIGDPYYCECPECGEIITNLWDFGSRLYEGRSICCEHCEKDVRVVSVETSVVIRLGKMEADHASDD